MNYSLRRQPRQRRTNRLLQSCRFCELLLQRRHQSRQLLLEGLIVTLDLSGSHITAGGQYVAVGGNLLGRGALAEPWNVLVYPRIRLTPPRMVGPSNAGDLLLRELPVRAVYQ